MKSTEEAKTLSVPEAGRRSFDLGRNASYDGRQTRPDPNNQNRGENSRPNRPT